jgi:hypothetical protein
MPTSYALLTAGTYFRSPSTLVPERNGMSMPKHDLSSRYFQRKFRNVELRRAANLGGYGRYCCPSRRMFDFMLRHQGFHAFFSA